MLPGAVIFRGDQITTYFCGPRADRGPWVKLASRFVPHAAAAGAYKAVVAWDSFSLVLRRE